MYVIKIDRRKFLISVSIVFGLFIIMAVLHAVPNRKMSINTFLTASDTTGENTENIEIFDISEGKVIYQYKPNSIFQKEATRYLAAVTGMYTKLRVVPDSGYIVKVPLNPPVQASGKWLAASGLTNIDKVYVIFPLQAEPYLLILDKQSRPVCFHFSADTSTLKEYLTPLLTPGSVIFDHMEDN